MVADQPLDHVSLATAVGYPSEQVRAALSGAGRRVRRAGPRLRPAQRRRRLAVLHPRGVRRRGRAVRARGAAGPADPGRPRDAGRGGLQAAGQPGPGVGGARGQRGRRDAHAGGPRAWSRRPGTTSETTATLYRTTGYFLERIGVTSLEDLPELAPFLPDMATSTTCPGIGGPGRAPRPSRDERRPLKLDDDGLIRLQKLLAQSGVASRRKCEELMLEGAVEVDGEVVTRLGTKVDPRTAVIRVEGRRLPPVSAARLPGAEQASRGGLHDVGPGGPPNALGLPGRPARTALPRRAARHRHRGPDPAHQRR